MVSWKLDASVVADLSLSSVQSNIESLVLKITHSILAGNGFAFDVQETASRNRNRSHRDSGLIACDGDADEKSSRLRRFMVRATHTASKTATTTAVLASSLVKKAHGSDHLHVRDRILATNQSIQEKHQPQEVTVDKNVKGKG
ncbi:hypothetical protein KIW84_040955 [Lathyrus oleraceus]|uniref:Uncharacterized protein n=1 Tax=Pisum sativum TaxID=3888 RepID=A0A9D4X7F7_PEA|nr:hypothetical protein KIW84_040955 [Pisum sativum]